MSNFMVSFEAMGSHIQVWLNAPELANARPLEKVRDWFEHWESIFSRFRATSELSHLNAQAGHTIKVSLPMFEVITAAVQAAAVTDGVFNPLILGALVSAGYDHSFNAEHFIPGSTLTDHTVGDWREIVLDSAALTVRLPAASRLDLGGIVKGWAAQKTAQRLSMVGPCLVDAGGDIVARGTPDETGGWLVSIRHPDLSQTLYTVLLTDSTIATSGIDYRHWTRDGQTLHHLIDPRTGQPAESDILSASVIAPDAVQAEVWAKTALITGQLPDLPALLIRRDYSVLHETSFDQLCVQKTQ
ncbi:MAG: FAD:protein FMN transferase [Chloroflexota bacterium]